MPSSITACQTCKIRRIKCDGTKPVCQRCTKSQRICVEMTVAKQVSFVVHSENGYASGKTKRPRGPRSCLTVMRPHLDLQTRAITYYLNHHLQTLTDVPLLSGGLAECVSFWRASGRTCPMVDLALTSMALAVYSRTRQCLPAAAEAFSRYQSLLRVARERITQVGISTLDEHNIDACLLTIFLMGRYEGVVHGSGAPNVTNSFTSLQSFSHHDGAMATLKLWSDNPNHNAASPIIKQTRRGLIRSALLRGRSLPGWMLDGSRFGERDLELDHDRIMVRTVHLRHTYADLQQQSDLQVAKAEELNNEARDLHKALQEWIGQISSTCAYRRHALTELDAWPKRHFYSSTVYSYLGLGHAVVWNRYFTAGMLINSTRLNILKSIRSVDEHESIECTIVLQDVADGLAATIPFSLERFDVAVLDGSVNQILVTAKASEKIKPHLASTIGWPLTVASNLEGIDVRQQSWFRSELAELGRIVGDGILETAETNQWAILCRKSS